MPELRGGHAAGTGSLLLRAWAAPAFSERSPARIQLEMGLEASSLTGASARRRAERSFHISPDFPSLPEVFHLLGPRR